MGDFTPINYAELPELERVEEGNPVPIQLVIHYLEKACASAKSDKELRALRNAELIAKSIEEIEWNARPGGLSSQGFLGAGEF